MNPELGLEKTWQGAHAGTSSRIHYRQLDSIAVAREAVEWATWEADQTSKKKEKENEKQKEREKRRSARECTKSYVEEWRRSVHGGVVSRNEVNLEEDSRPTERSATHKSHRERQDRMEQSERREKEQGGTVIQPPSAPSNSDIDVRPDQLSTPLTTTSLDPTSLPPRTSRRGILNALEGVMKRVEDLESQLEVANALRTYQEPQATPVDPNVSGNTRNVLIEEAQNPLIRSQQESIALRKGALPDSLLINLQETGAREDSGNPAENDTPNGEPPPKSASAPEHNPKSEPGKEKPVEQDDADATEQEENEEGVLVLPEEDLDGDNVTVGTFEIVEFDGESARVESDLESLSSSVYIV